MVTRSDDSLSIGFFPLDKFLATTPVSGGIIFASSQLDFLDVSRGGSQSDPHLTIPVHTTQWGTVIRNSYDGET